MDQPNPFCTAAANAKEVQYNLPYQDLAAPVMGERR
jgi:hypothetical protein